jgi:hypothetical protein
MKKARLDIQSKAFAGSIKVMELFEKKVFLSFSISAKGSIEGEEVIDSHFMGRSSVTV